MRFNYVAFNVIRVLPDFALGVRALLAVGSCDHRAAVPSGCGATSRSLRSQVNQRDFTNRFMCSESDQVLCWVSRKLPVESECEIPPTSKLQPFRYLMFNMQFILWIKEILLLVELLKRFHKTSSYGWIVSCNLLFISHLVGFFHTLVSYDFLNVCWDEVYLLLHWFEKFCWSKSDRLKTSLQSEVESNELHLLALL